jgi:putative peptide zinc metalloprotease protein
MVIARGQPPTRDAVAGRPPSRDPGVALLGEYQGSGYKEPPALVRRSDGQILQLPPLLYEVLKAIDGERGSAEIAAVVSDKVQRTFASEDIDFLIDEKLSPSTC